MRPQHTVHSGGYRRWRSAASILSISGGDPECCDRFRNFVFALPGKVLAKNRADDLRLRFIYFQHPILQAVAEGSLAGDEVPTFHAMLVAPAHIAGDTLALLLSDGGEHGGEKFAGHFRGVDALLLEAHPHADGLQLPDRLQAVSGVPGEAGDGFDQDLVHPPPAAVREEPLEVQALLCRGPRDPRIGVDVRHGPVVFTADQRRVVVQLGSERVHLIAGVGAHPAVGGNTELLRLRPLRGLYDDDFLLFQRKVSVGLLSSAHGLHLLLSATHNTTPLWQ